MTPEQFRRLSPRERCKRRLATYPCLIAAMAFIGWIILGGPN